MGGGAAATTATTTTTTTTSPPHHHLPPRALARGFIQGCNGCLTQAEAELLYTAVWVITFEQGVRFLTDYLNGDVYYAQRRHNHNWCAHLPAYNPSTSKPLFCIDSLGLRGRYRLRAQFRVVELLEQQQQLMQQVVQEEWQAVGGVQPPPELELGMRSAPPPQPKMIHATSGRGGEGGLGLKK